ncbi:YhdP family protein [Neptuniibacter marinus]|uniref:YhdP family protein n=1 Tax=Neptuniibacter marinus TaxID=1806670 RepID=UPI000832556B|nr:YhdP family protein [Neptuniibacter marinus]
MKRHAHSVMWFIYWLLAFLCALLACASIVLKVLVDDLSLYRQDVEAFLSSQLNAKVHIADLQGRWDGWQPVVSIDGLSVDKLADQPELSFVLLRGDVKFDPAASIRAFTLIFSQLDLKSMTLRYDLSQEVAVGEQNAAGSEKNDGTDLTKIELPHSGFLAFLLQQSSINMSDTRIVMQPKHGDAVSVAPIQLSLQHDGVLHQLKVDADLVSTSGQAALKFLAEAEGNPSKKAVNFYLKFEGVDEQLLNPWLKLVDIQLDSLNGAQEVWGQSYRGRLTYLTGRTLIQDFKYQDYALEQFTVQTALNRRDRGYQLQITDFQVDSENSGIEIPKISLDFEREGYLVKPRSLMVDKIELASTFDFLLKRPFLPEEVQSAFSGLSPVGTVKNILVSWPSFAKLQDFELAADLENVGINAWTDVPEIKGINGLLMVNRAGGEIHLASSDFLMHYPTLFEQAWDYNDAEGVIGWRFEDKGIVVASQLLNLANDKLTAAGRFSLYLPFDRDEQPLLNLQIGLQGADGLQAKYYIPPKEVGLETYEWLVKAIQQGEIKRAGFVLNGVTRARLPDYQLPTVQLFFDLADASFEYQPGWPAIKQADGFIYFRNGELVAEAAGGSIYDSALNFAWIHLPQSSDKLFVAGSVDGDAIDLQRLLTESDLRTEIGDDFSDWALSGPISTLVNLNLPLAGKSEPQVFVKSEIKQGRFQSVKDKISFSKINGVINYDYSIGLSSDVLKAELFEQPVTANISSRLISNKVNKTEVSIDGSVNSDYLANWLESDFLSLLQGPLKYNARLDLCPGKVCNQLVIKSDLKGTQINAFPPLSKTKSQTMPLTVVSDLGLTYADDRSVVRLNLANQLRGVLIDNDKGLERARFSLGGAKPEIPEESGIWVDGALADLDYAQLDGFLSGLGFNGVAGKSGAQSSNLAGSKLKQVELSLSRFSAGGFDLNNLSFSLKPEPLGWMLRAQSKELTGGLWLPNNEGSSYKVELAELRLKRDESDAEVEDEALPESVDIDPASIPSVDFNIKKLFIGSKPLGNWSFKLRPYENDIRLEDIQADIHGAEVRGGLRWVTGDNEVSDLTLKLNSSNFSQLLKALDVKAIETKSLDSYLQLSWNHAPWAFDIADANGELQFTAKQGRILDVGKSGNILRVFGILNLQSLGRRLRLDFTDLVESGVAFDEMKASYKIKQGIAHTSSPFVMTGPSANMVMQGSLNLVNETVDKDIEVALPVTGNIPLVSVLLGAPQVAGAVFLFDKLVGDPLAKFTTVKYHLSGDWGDPSIVIDDGKTTKPANKKNPSVMDNDHG